MPELDGGDLGRARHEVVQEGRRERVAHVVVREVLEQRAADALDDAAGDLAFDNLGVDHRAAVLAHDVTQQLDESCVHVDLARAHVRGVDPDRRIGR